MVVICCVTARRDAKESKEIFNHSSEVKPKTLQFNKPTRDRDNTRLTLITADIYCSYGKIFTYTYVPSLDLIYI